MPEVTVHKPVPIVGLFPAKVKAAVLHCVIADPALDVVGVALLVRTTVEVDAVHDPLLIVHVNVGLVPAVTPVTPEL